MKRLRKFIASLVERRSVLQTDPVPITQSSDLALQTNPVPMTQSGSDIALLTDLTPITQFSDMDIFIAGYPKSGNTWFQNLITGIYFGVNPELAPDTLIQELVPDVHFKKYYRRFKTPMFFKTHDLPRPEYKRVIYLVRDGRDVMVSYNHYRIAIMNEKVDFMAMVRDGEGLFPGKWHEHVQAWDANPYQAEKIVIKYEDLKQDPLTVLTQFCDFAQIERDQTFLRQVIDQTEFAKLQAKERDGRIFFANQIWPTNKNFFRRGIVGSYKDEMPQDVLEVFLQDASPMLSQMGYV
jgi:hypothetical protein